MYSVLIVGLQIIRVILNILVSTTEKNCGADIAALQSGLAVHSGSPEVLARYGMYPAVVPTMCRYIAIRCFGHSTLLHIICVKADMFDSHLSTINLPVHRNETCAIVCSPNFTVLRTIFPRDTMSFHAKTYCICELSKQYWSVDSNSWHYWSL